MCKVMQCCGISRELVIQNLYIDKTHGLASNLSLQIFDPIYNRHTDIYMYKYGHTCSTGIVHCVRSRSTGYTKVQSQMYVFGPGGSDIGMCAEI